MPSVRFGTYVFNLVLGFKKPWLVVVQLPDVPLKRLLTLDILHNCNIVKKCQYQFWNCAECLQAADALFTALNFASLYVAKRV